MKPCGESRNAPGKNGRARHEAVRENTYVQGKGGGQVLHCSSAGRTLRHTQSVPSSARHPLAHGKAVVHERQPCTVSARLAVCAAFARTWIAAVRSTLNGKRLPPFYAFRQQVSLRSSSKRRWHGICSCRAAVFCSASGQESDLHVVRSPRVRRSGGQSQIVYPA